MSMARAEQVIRALGRRQGFGEWWDRIDAETRADILKALDLVIYVGDGEGSGFGMKLIAEERMRQVRVEHFDAHHDDKVNASGKTLPLAAACYAASAAGILVLVDGAPDNHRVRAIEAPDLWPWDKRWDKRPDKPADPDDPLEAGGLASREDRIRALVKAGALCAAEVDRLLREEAREAGK